MRAPALNLADLGDLDDGLHDEPHGLSIEWHDYQLEGAAWLASRKKAMLCDDMGLGKTGQSLLALDQLGAGRAIVVCPAVARANWQAEIPKFCVFERTVFALAEKKQIPALTEKLLATPFAVVIVSYELAEALLKNLAETVPRGTKPFDALICDESHYLKSLEAKRSVTVLGAQGLQSFCKRVWLLTGTPMPNNYAEMWLPLYVFGQTPLSYDAFVEEFCYSRKFNLYSKPQVTGSRKEKAPELARLMEPVVLRRTKEQVLMKQGLLPPLLWGITNVDPGAADLLVAEELITSFYPKDDRWALMEKVQHQRDLIHDALIAAKHRGLKGYDAGGVQQLRVLEAMAQTVHELRIYTGLLKVDAVANMIASELRMKTYEKIVVFAVHRAAIAALTRKLTQLGIKSVFYNGKLPEKTKVANIKQFKTDPETKVFIGNIQACGIAINLVEANNVVFLEQSYTPAENAQAVMRCHRIGQTKPVLARLVSLRGTFDARINILLRRKMADITLVIDKLPEDKALEMKTLAEKGFSL